MAADVITESASAGAGKPDKPNPVRALVDHFASVLQLVHFEGRAYAVPVPTTTPDGQRIAAPAALYGQPGVAQPFGGELRRRILRVSRLVPGLAPVSKATAETVMEHLSAEAFEGPATPLALRFAEHGSDEVVLDLGRDGRVVMIHSDSWEIADEPPSDTPFRRSHATKSLPVPARGGKLDELADLLALDPAGETFRALLGWVIGLPFVGSVRPGALLVGPPGAGKSTRLRLAASVVEPSGVDALGSAFGRNLDDDLVRASHRAVPLWDNLTALSGTASDALCCTITGTARERRQLYSDADLHLIAVQRPVGLTAVGVPAGLRPDALDRLIVLDVPPVAERISDAQLQARFDASHPRLLGALCDAVSAVLHWRAQLSAPTRYRMASHAHVLAAADAAVEAGELPGCPGGLLDAYDSVVSRVKERTVAEDTFGSALLALLERTGGTWSGKASELLLAAGMHAGYADRYAPGWPSSARRIPEVLAHLREGLALLGVQWETTTVRGSTRYYFTQSNETDL